MDFITASDRDGNIVEFNPAALRAFGYTQEEIMGLDVQEMYAREEDFTQVMASLARTGEYVGEVTNRRKNGDVFVCHLSACTLYNDAGEAIGVMGVSRDITSEKEAARLAELEENTAKDLTKQIENLSTIATSVANGIVISDPSGRVIWCNRSFEKLTQYSLQELKGNRPSEIFKTPHFFRDEFEDLVDKGPILSNAVQVAHYKKGGDLYWMLVESTPVYDDITGSLNHIIEVCIEITAQKKAEIALQETKRNFEQIASSIDDVFFLYSHFMREYEFISPNSEKVLGVTPDYFYDGGTFINDYILDEDRTIIRNSRMAILGGDSYDIEYRINHPDGIKWIHEKAFPIKDEIGNVVQSSGIASDITEMKANQEIIQEQNKAIAESIDYAQKIQEATLPSLDFGEEVFEDMFVFYRPKDQLGGDFYLYDFVRMEGVKLPSFIVADCTGHGVPGAILSILCNSLVKQTLTNHEVNSPAEALEVIRGQLISLFKSDALHAMMDGMDIGFAVYNPDSRELYYAGANMNCMVLRNGKWYELKGDKQHVGYSDNLKPFTHQVFQCEEGDNFYLFSDGYVDQFGGDNNKKYLRKNLIEFLKNSKNGSMKKQGDLLIKEFENWMGEHEQTDDICVLGVRLD